ncbi:MAG: DUF4249 family protein [Bacteroidota bacterium]
MRFTYLTFSGLLLFAVLCSCEDTISVPSQFEEPQLVVDAWLTNTNTPQTIILNETVPYFEGGTPRTIEDATVSVCKDGTEECFDFIHQGEGQYVWEPTGSETLGTVGDNFTLQLSIDGQDYTGASPLKRTARLDSIAIVFEEESIFLDEGLYAELFARDQVGRGDTYWVRAYRNDTLLNRPAEQVVAFDAVFDAGADVDGVYFIPPLRTAAVNKLDDDGAFIPYQSGDRIYAEVHSINLEAFRFLQIALEQIQNEGIFAVPVANAPGNVTNVSTGAAILGIFNVAEVNSIEKVVD